MSKTSNDIANEIMKLTNEIDSLEEHCNEDPNDIPTAEYLRMLKSNLEREMESLIEKVDAFGEVKDEIENTIEFLKKKSDKLYQRAKIKENNLARMKEYIAFVMQKLQLKKLNGVEHDITLRSPSVSLEVDPLEESDIERLPEKYWKVKTESYLVKDVIKQELLKGEKLEWARLKEKQSVSIK